MPLPDLPPSPPNIPPQYPCGYYEQYLRRKKCYDNCKSLGSLGPIFNNLISPTIAILAAQYGLAGTGIHAVVVPSAGSFIFAPGLAYSLYTPSLDVYCHIQCVADPWHFA
jgi:hypothetical protein